MRRATSRRPSHMAPQTNTLMDSKDFTEHPCLVTADTARMADALPAAWTVSWTVSPEAHDDALSRCLLDQLPVVCSILRRNVFKFGLDDIHPGAHVVGVSSLCTELFGKASNNSNNSANQPGLAPHHEQEQPQQENLPTMPTISELRLAFARHPNTMRWLSLLKLILTRVTLLKSTHRVVLMQLASQHSDVVLGGKTDRRKVSLAVSQMREVLEKLTCQRWTALRGLIGLMHTDTAIARLLSCWIFAAAAPPTGAPNSHPNTNAPQANVAALQLAEALGAFVVKHCDALCEESMNPMEDIAPACLMLSSSRNPAPEQTLGLLAQSQLEPQSLHRHRRGSSSGSFSSSNGMMLMGGGVSGGMKSIKSTFAGLVKRSGSSSVISGMGSTDSASDDGGSKRNGSVSSNTMALFDLDKYVVDDNSSSSPSDSNESFAVEEDDNTPRAEALTQQHMNRSNSTSIFDRPARSRSSLERVFGRAPPPPPPPPPPPTSIPPPPPSLFTNRQGRGGTEATCVRVSKALSRPPAYEDMVVQFDGSDDGEGENGETRKETRCVSSDDEDGDDGVIDDEEHRVMARRFSRMLKVQQYQRHDAEESAAAALAARKQVQSLPAALVATTIDVNDVMHDADGDVMQKEDAATLGFVASPLMDDLPMPSKGTRVEQPIFRETGRRRGSSVELARPGWACVNEIVKKHEGNTQTSISRNTANTNTASAKQHQQQHNARQSESALPRQHNSNNNVSSSSSKSSGKRSSRRRSSTTAVSAAPSSNISSSDHNTNTTQRPDKEHHHATTKSRESSRSGGSGGGNGVGVARRKSTPRARTKLPHDDEERVGADVGSNSGCSTTSSSRRKTVTGVLTHSSSSSYPIDEEENGMLDVGRRSPLGEISSVTPNKLRQQLQLASSEQYHKRSSRG